MPALITQTTGAMRAVTAALLRKSCSRPVAVVCADDAAASTLAADLRALLGEEVTVLTSRDPVLRDTEVVSRQSEQQRLRALDAVASGAGVCVLTAAGLTERTLPPDVLADTAFTLAVGEGNGPEALEPRLLACGYRRGDMVEGPGQFSRRGGILDIFSPGADRPVRAEFWGDEIDSMGFFDTDTQRRTENIQSFRVLPACEALTSVRDGSALAGTLEGRARTLARRAGGEEAAARLRRDAERIREGASLPWADRYLPYIYEDYITALDYLSPDTLIVLDSPGRCAERSGELLDQLREDVRLLTGAAIPVQEAEAYFLPWKDMTERLAEFALVMTDAFTAGRYPVSPRSTLACEARQLPSYGGSLETALEDVRRFLDEEYRVVVLSADERRAAVLGSMLEKNALAPLRGYPNGELPPFGRCTVAVGSLSAGLEMPEIRLAVLTDTLVCLCKKISCTGSFFALSVREEIGKFIYPYPSTFALFLILNNSLPQIFKNNL